MNPPDLYQIAARMSAERFMPVSEVQSDHEPAPTSGDTDAVCAERARVLLDALDGRG